MNRIHRRLILASARVAVVVFVLAVIEVARSQDASQPELNLARGWITSALFSHDGKYLLTGSPGGAQLWETETGKELRRFQGHFERVHFAIFSPDEKQVLTGAGGEWDMGVIPKDCTARLFDVGTAVEIECFRHGGRVQTGAFSPDGKSILTAGRDSRAVLWHMATGERQRVFSLSGLQCLPGAVGFNADATRIVGLLSANGQAAVWDSKTGKELIRIDGGELLFGCARFNPSGKLILTACHDFTARTWDAQSGAAVRGFRGHESHIHDAAFSADGSKIITASADRTVKIWDTSAGTQIRQFKHPGPVTDGVLSSDAKRLLATWDKWDRQTKVGGFVSLWNAETEEELKTFELSQRHHRGIAVFSPDGKTAFVTPEDGPLLIDAATGDVIRAYATPDRQKASSDGGADRAR
jgi:WD40 repeat protein